MENKNLENLESLVDRLMEISDSKCPHIKCKTYGKFYRCSNKVYLLCRRYTEFYEKWYNSQINLLKK